MADMIADLVLAQKRELFTEHGCSSLFEYLLEHGYAKSCASQRLNAVRMAINIPSVLEKLRSGDLNLAKISVVARACERTLVPISKRAELFEMIKDYDERDSEIIVCRELGIEPEIVEKIRVQADGSVRVETTYSKEQWETIQKAKDVRSHINPSPTIADLTFCLAEEYLKRNDPARGSDPNQRPASVRRQTFQKDKCCQWRHDDGTICGSTFLLQLDHIKPRYKGGTDDPENLQVLCAFHNRLKYRRGS